jgi:hypothetical protein
MKTLGRAVIRRFDAFLCRCLGVYEFSSDAECILRVQKAVAARPLNLPGGVIPKGAAVLKIHLWNEHVPPMPAAGPDLAWAAHVSRCFVRSLHSVAGLLRKDPSLTGARAVGGVTALLPIEGRSGSTALMKRLGFTILPYHNPLGSFSEFWENLYTWGLMWAYNPISLQHHQFFRLHRAEIWMPIENFLARF